MKISAAQAYCILDTVGSSILTKSGEISVSYLLELPEAYSLDRSDLEERHNELFRAFQYVRTGFIHKQDVFLRRKFKPEYVIEGEGYIQTAERKYFDGREYLHHFCILSFTLSGLQSLEKAYQANPLAYSEKLAKADRDRLAEFLESVESAVSIIRNIRGTQIRPLNVAEVKQHLFRYVNGFHDDEGRGSLNSCLCFHAFVFKVLDYVSDCIQICKLLCRDLNVVLILKSHNQLKKIQRICSKIILKRCLRCNYRRLTI